jgi:hypothetical protein
MAVVIADAVAEVGVSGRDGTALLWQDGDQVAVLLVSALTPNLEGGDWLWRVWVKESLTFCQG